MFIESITDLLGKVDDRYFSNGFKYFNFEYGNFSCQNKMLKGSVCCKHDWDKKRKKHLHLGSVEYIALAATVCEHILESEFFLSSEEIASSWISHFKMKIQSCIDLSENANVSISGKLISMQKTEDFDNRCKSHFEVLINNTLIKITINHLVCFEVHTSASLNACVNVGSVYCTGYKKRSHHIKNIILNEAFMNCTASVSIEDNCSHTLGLGSRYNGIILTDIILISGQLVQALFYTIEKTDRYHANNLWLKEFEVSIQEPYCKMYYEARISFEDVKILRMGNETWKSVQLKSELSNIISNIKIVSQINN